MAKLLIILSIVINSISVSAKSENFEAFESLILKMMEETGTPGVAVGVFDKSGPLFLKGFGVKEVGTSNLVTPNTQFAIGSTTKAMTAASLGILVDKHILDWDRPLKEEYLTDFELMDSQATNLATLRDLLTHRTGLPRHDLSWYGSSDSREELYKKLKYLKPSKVFREAMQYQNLMYMTAGIVIERVTGISWEEFIVDNLFKPLGMNNTTVSLSAIQKSSDYSYPHSLQKKKAYKIPFRNIDAVGPAGSVNSSITDMGKWLRLQLNKGISGDHVILNKDTIKEIHKGQISTRVSNYPELKNPKYALGWGVHEFYGEKLIHHGGGIDGFVTFVGFLPEHDRAIVVFGNSESIIPYFIGFSYFESVINFNFGPWLDRLQRRDLKPIPPVKYIERKELDRPISDYTGKYFHAAYGVVEIKDGSEYNSDLLVEFRDVLKAPVAKYQDDKFMVILDEIKLNPSHDIFEFRRDLNDNVSKFLYKFEPLVDPIEFLKL